MRLALFTGFLLAGIAGFGNNVYAHERHEISAKVVNERPAMMGRRSPVRLELSNRVTGEPVTFDDLAKDQARPMHLFIIDPALEDYHHVYPTKGDESGEYLFIFKPNTDCHYRVWVNMRMPDQQEQYQTADIAGHKDCKNAEIDDATVMEYESGGYSYKLEFDSTLSKGLISTGKVTVRDAKGRLFRDLEPYEGEYMHVVGFYDDYHNIAHLHPKGEKPEDETDLGGPKIEFEIKPEYAGFLKLYVRFFIDGREHVVPFGVTVKG